MTTLTKAQAEQAKQVRGLETLTRPEAWSYSAY